MQNKSTYWDEIIYQHEGLKAAVKWQKWVLSINDHFHRPKLNLKTHRNEQMIAGGVWDNIACCCIPKWACLTLYVGSNHICKEIQLQQPSCVSLSLFARLRPRRTSGYMFYNLKYLNIPLRELCEVSMMSIWLCQSEYGSQDIHCEIRCSSVFTPNVFWITRN